MVRLYRRVGQASTCARMLGGAGAKFSCCARTNQQSAKTDQQENQQTGHSIASGRNRGGRCRHDANRALHDGMKTAFVTEGSWRCERHQAVAVGRDGVGRITALRVQRMRSQRPIPEHLLPDGDFHAALWIRGDRKRPGQAAVGAGSGAVQKHSRLTSLNRGLGRGGRRSQQGRTQGNAEREWLTHARTSTVWETGLWSRVRDNIGCRSRTMPTTCQDGDCVRTDRCISCANGTKACAKPTCTAEAGSQCQYATPICE